MQLVSRPCSEGGRAPDIIIDAGFSADPSGRPLARTRWSQPDAQRDVVIAAAIERANAANGGKGAPRHVQTALKSPV
jgi:hypothetical protein